MIEGINEKIRKRFKNLKLSNSNCAKICKHASVAWCRSILISLALITPLPAKNTSVQAPLTIVAGSKPSLLLYVDLQTNDLWSSSFEDPVLQKALEMKWSQVLFTMKHVHIKQASEENIEATATLLRCTYNFYRESSCGTLPSNCLGSGTEGSPDPSNGRWNTRPEELVEEIAQVVGDGREDIKEEDLQRMSYLKAE
ncbi:calcineurin-binding protein 1-like isoform X2 [Magnolia sinica]|uniref:calcineurin-binding protein 1-like isoform X2 n=1 Tax=Magnolia sinica TaxID=86752 RepID=UPI00265B3282|nr:calcineurin-binding protein 1-like isoform X2 [Magnolia sinica]